MNFIKISYDYRSLSEKPDKYLTASISKKIGMSPMVLDIDKIKEFALKVSCEGNTFSPATFKNGKRCKSDFEQQQLFVLDFDNKNSESLVSFEEIYKRAEYYELPVLFAYETLSSTDYSKFRVVFLNDVSVTDSIIAESMQLAMGIIFPEADSSCLKDISKMYYGGKNIIYYNKNIQMINIEVLFRNLSRYFKDKFKANHYKEKIALFSKNTGIALNQNGLLDVTVSESCTEDFGASSNAANGKNSPSTIIYKWYYSNIIADGEIFPNRYYCINLVNDSVGCTDKYSVQKVSLKLKNHAAYRSTVIAEMKQKCRLYNQFVSGERKLSHDELFGLATNLIHIETGVKTFKSVVSKYIYYCEKKNKWEHDLLYMKQQEYLPQSCSGFCPHKETCNHGINILSTIHTKRGTIEKIPNYNTKFYSLEEVQKDTYSAICKAYKANDKQFQIVKSMTGAGKSHSYLRLMSENPNNRFLIATPTNLLKNEIYTKAKGMGINVEFTPSLDELKSEMPKNVWNTIQGLYKIGRCQSVKPYIHNILANSDIPCLKAYLEKCKKLKTFEGSLITTHRYLLNMDEKKLKEYDAVVIDEDIIFKSIITNQGSVTVSELKTILNETSDSRLSVKIKQILRDAVTQSCIETDGFEYEYESDDNNLSVLFDIRSFCLARRFYLHKSSEEQNLKENTLVYLNPATFKNVKYIIVSATADEKIYKNFFGEDNVSFYECKRAKYKGTLKQYPEKSMSRTCIANNPGIIQNLMKYFSFDKDRVITFMRENIGHLHFGNTEGSNLLEGKDVLIVGTPYHAEFLYKLTAFTMGLYFEEDEKMALQLAVHNGYRFAFTTFKNENLKSIHFWMLESELEQAVGRARLLRNECTVHLFSNFPLGQAEMTSIF